MKVSQHCPDAVCALITYSDDASTGIDRGFEIGQDIDIPAELPTPMQMQQYIRIEYHPHSRRADTIIDLSSSSGLVSPRNSSQPQSAKPFAPFPTHQDFTFAEHVVTSNMTNSDIDGFIKQLCGGKNAWAENCRFQARTAQTVRQYLDQAAHSFANVSCFVDFVILRNFWHYSFRSIAS